MILDNIHNCIHALHIRLDKDLSVSEGINFLTENKLYSLENNGVEWTVKASTG